MTRKSKLISISIIYLTIFQLHILPISAQSTVALPPRLCEVTNIIENLINIALGAGGLVTFIMIIFGAVSWITAGADDKKLSQARSTITWGIIGLILLVSSFFILVIIESFTGVSLTKIEFPWINPSGSNIVPRPAGC